MYAVLEGVEGLVVPKVYNDWSALRVITYQYIDGQPLGEFLQSKPSLAQRQRVTELLAKGFWAQIFGNGIMHADPHPGNYLITPGGDLALLDFGCVKIFSEAWSTHFVELILSRVGSYDRDAERDAILALDMVVDPDDVTEVEDIRLIGDYFGVGITDDAPVNFADYNYATRGRELIQHFLGNRRMPKSQQDFIFLTRVSLGLYEYFSKLSAPVNYHRIAMPFIKDGWRGRKIPIHDYYLPEV